MIDADDEISKNKLCYECKIQRTRLNMYCKNEVQRVDLKILAKLCDFFHCTPNDVLEYVKDNE